jgi:hypothetical protein
VQDPQYNAIHAKLLRRQDVVSHNLKFMIGVTKIASPGANQDVDGKAHVAAGSLHQSGAGSDSPGRQVAAELNPVRPAELRRDGVVHRFDTDFEHRTIRHELRVRRTRALRDDASTLGSVPHGASDRLISAAAIRFRVAARRIL